MYYVNKLGWRRGLSQMIMFVDIWGGGIDEKIMSIMLTY